MARPTFVSARDWADPDWHIRHQIRTTKDLEQWITVSERDREAIEAYSRKRKRWGVTPYYASLMRRDDPACPIRVQALPSVASLAPAPAWTSEEGYWSGFSRFARCLSSLYASVHAR